MTPTIAELLRAHSTKAVDVDSAGRVLVGDDRSGSTQLYEVDPDGGWRQLTDLGEPCSGRYLPGERIVVVEHDSGGNERAQLSLLHIEDNRLEPFVHEPKYIHNVLDVLPGRVIYATNRRDGVEFDVVVRTVDTGDERVLYDGGGWVMDVAVAPDESRLVLMRPSKAPNSSQLLLVDTATGAVDPLNPEDEPARYTNPRWLPDGSAFLCTTNTGREFTGIARYDVDNRTLHYLHTAESDLHGWPAPDGSGTLIAARVGASDRAWIERDGTSTPLDLPPQSLIGWLAEPVWAADGSRVVMTVSSPTEPGDAYAWDGTGLRRITDSSADLDKVSLITAESHDVQAHDGETIPCLLYRPAQPAGSAVVLVHGGPESQSVTHWSPVVQALALAGHCVVVPNVRGSTGYGKRWAALDDVELRLDSVADLASVHDWLPSVGLDKDRAALYGGSYGGYMVLAGVSMQPERWAAGVDIVGISSLVTLLENTSVYRRAAREREYGSLEHHREFLLRASPITYVDDIRASLLIVHGANDPRVPLSEAEQIATALRARDVACEMYVYADEGHGLGKLHNKLDAYPRIVDFLTRQLAS